MDPLSLLVLIGGVLAGSAVATKPPEPSGWSYGVRTPDMIELISRVVPGALVFDLGAGTELVDSHIAIELGADRVIAIDKSRMIEPRDTRIERLGDRYSIYNESLIRDAGEAKARGQRVVSIVSWPNNNERSEREIFQILDASDFVIYRGHNFSGTACGFSDLYRYFLERPVQAVIEHPSNTMIVYGPQGVRTMPPIPEELAGLMNSQGSGVIEFQDRNGLPGNH